MKNKNKNKNKGIKAVNFINTIRNQVHKEIKDMSVEELKKYYEEQR